MKIGSIVSDDDDLLAAYKRRKSTKKYRSNLVSPRFLLMLIKVMVSDLLINRRILANIKRFLSIIDRKYYSADETVEALLLTCDMILSIRFKNPSEGPNIETLKYKIQTEIQEPYDKIRDNLIIPQIASAKEDLPTEDLEYISNTLDQNLKYDYVFKAKEELVDLSNEITNCNYNDFPDLLMNFRALVTDIQNFFRSTDSSSRANEVVHTADPTFIDYIKDTFDVIKNPSSALQTGWQALNSALGPRGGFQNKAFYLFHANTNSFKSAMLLHVARMISMYNTSRLMEDYKKTGKIPTILFIALENDDTEDYERLYKTIVKRDMDHYTSTEELVSAWKHANNVETTEYGENYMSNNAPIDISFLHLDARGISVDGIDTTIELVEEEGYKVVGTVVDYIGLIDPRKEDYGKENRLQLKNIAEDLLGLAKRRNMPVISAHQVNRSGGALLQNLKNQGASMVVSQMTNEFIGESYGIEQAVTWSAFIDLETRGEKRYLTFKRNKSRYKNKYGCEQFVMEIKDGIIIEDDLYLDKPLSMQTIPGDMPDNSEMMNTTVRGVVDIRDKDKRQPPKVDNTITIKPNYDNRELVTNMAIERLTMKDWFFYIDDLGFENLTVDMGAYYDHCQGARIGETEYYISDTECSIYDLM